MVLYFNLASSLVGKGKPVNATLFMKNHQALTSAVGVYKQDPYQTEFLEGCRGILVVPHKNSTSRNRIFVRSINSPALPNPRIPAGRVI
jgi:hypothetical protein